MVAAALPAEAGPCCGSLSEVRYRIAPDVSQARSRPYLRDAVRGARLIQDALLPNHVAAAATLARPTEAAGVDSRMSHICIGDVLNSTDTFRAYAVTTVSYGVFLSHPLEVKPKYSTNIFYLLN